MKCVVDCKVHLTNKNWPTIATLHVNKKPVGEVDRQVDQHAVYNGDFPLTN